MIPTTALQPLFQALLYSANVELLKDVLSWLQKASNLSKEEYPIVKEALRQYLIKGKDLSKRQEIVPAYTSLLKLEPQASSPALGMSLLQNFLSSSNSVLNSAAFTTIQDISSFSTEAKAMVQGTLSQELIKENNSDERNEQLVAALEKFTQLIREEQKNDLQKKLVSGTNTEEENERLLRALEEDLGIPKVEEVPPQPEIKEKESKKVPTVVFPTSKELVEQGQAKETGTAQKRGQTVREALDNTIEKLVRSVVEKLADKKTDKAFKEALQETPFDSGSQLFTRTLHERRKLIDAALSESFEENNEKLLKIQEDLLNEVNETTDEYTKLWIACIARFYTERQRNKSFEGIKLIGPELKRHICELLTAEWKNSPKISDKLQPSEPSKTEDLMEEAKIALGETRAQTAQLKAAYSVMTREESSAEESEEEKPVKKVLKRKSEEKPTPRKSGKQSEEEVLKKVPESSLPHSPLGGLRPPLRFFDKSSKGAQTPGKMGFQPYVKPTTKGLGQK